MIKRAGDQRARLPGIRTQLTVLYTTIFAVMTILGGVIFYQAVRAAIERGFDTSLKIHTDQIASGVSQTDQGAILVTDATGELLDLDPTPTPTPDPTMASPTLAAGRPTPDPAQPTPDSTQPTATPDTTTTVQTPVNFATMVRVLDGRGNVVYASPAFRALSVPRASFSQAASGTPWSGTVHARNGQLVRLYSEAQTADDGTVYAIVQVGESLDPLAATFNTVLFTLLLVFPGVLVVDAMLSYWLAGRTFSPLARLTRTARAIQGGNLQQRVPIPRTNDEVRRLALTFNAMIDRLEAAFVRQRRFVADASHELRTPVAAIRGITEVALTEARTPAEYVVVLQEVIDEAERLGVLISDLLLLARADEGQVTIARELVQIDQVVGDVLAAQWPRAEEAGVQLIATLAPVTVIGDEARLIQIVINLVDNALTYTDRGGTVTVATSAEAGMACLRVSDTGIGIAAADLPHIFERFYRTDAARSRATGGAGLGLALVQWLVEAHAGSIDANSMPGVGTTIIVWFPSPSDQKLPDGHHSIH